MIRPTPKPYTLSWEQTTVVNYFPCPQYWTSGNTQGNLPHCPNQKNKKKERKKIEAKNWIGSYLPTWKLRFPQFFQIFKFSGMIIWNHKLNNYLTSPPPKYNRSQPTKFCPSPLMKCLSHGAGKLNFNIWPTQAPEVLLRWLWTKAALCCTSAATGETLPRIKGSSSPWRCCANSIAVHAFSNPVCQQNYSICGKS